MEQFGASRDARVDDSVDVRSVDIARGSLLALAAPSVAALALPGDASGATALRILAEIVTIPALFALAGWIMAHSIAAPRPATLARAVVAAALCGLASVFLAGLAATLAGLEWRLGVARAASVWSLAFLPAIYALLARGLRASPAMRLALALAAHVAGVIFGIPLLSHFVFFVAGLELATRGAAFLAIAEEEPEFALASGPFVAALAAAVAIRFGQTGQSPSLAALGPIGLAFGLAAGPAALASAAALARTRIGEAFAILGRAAPALVVFWFPLLLTLIAFAHRGAAPSGASVFLMAVASMLSISVATDVAVDASRRARWRRAAAHS